MSAPVEAPGTPEGASPLDRLAALARDLGAAALAAEAAETAARLGDRRFFVACVGQFKRGKSTLLNALVGQPVLPVGVAPVTSVVTVLRAGPVPTARVRWRDGAEATIEVASLADYVDERRNPGNVKGVAGIEVFLPAAILEHGLCLVDTPGVGSVFGANTEATRAFLPHVDAALVVLGTDPPLAEAELHVIADLAQHVDDLVLVLNKADRATADERQEAAAFARQVLERTLHRPCGPLLQVSATERLAGRTDLRDWTELEGRLRALATHRREAIVAGAAARATRRLAARLEREVEERLAALARPVEASAARVERLRAGLRDVERALADLSYLFASTEAELARRFECLREAFLTKAVPATAAALDRALAEIAAGSGPRRWREEALTAARVTAQRVIDDWRVAIEPEAERMYDAAVRRFVDLANECLVRLGEDHPDGRVVAEQGFRERRHFYFAALMSLTATGPWTWLGDRVLPASRVRQRVGRAALAYATHLLETNAMRVEFDLRERVLASRRALERDVRQRLTEALGRAERALDEARARLAEGTAAVAQRVAQLEALRVAIRDVAATADDTQDHAGRSQAGGGDS